MFNQEVSGKETKWELEQYSGIFNTADVRNRFRDWHHVYIAYCTGDIHWGDITKDYGTVQIEHRGAANSRAVLDWLYANHPAPEQIFVTGCSAGSYGSALWAAHIMQHYPATQVIQFGDSGSGVITDEFFRNGFPSWNVEAAYPSWIPALDPETREIRYSDLFIGIANFYPTNFMSQFNYASDSAQHFYFREMGGGDEQAMSSQMLASFDAIEAGASNFASFVPLAPGHCILPYDDFYTVSANGTMLVDWINELLSTGSVESAWDVKK